MQTDARRPYREIEKGTIEGLGRTYQIVEQESGEIFVNTLNSWFRVARSYAEFLSMNRASIERRIYDEELEGERNMSDLYGPSMGR